MPLGRKAKIVATLGPASTDPERMEDLLDAGANVFRINFSHGTHADHGPVFETVRSMEPKVGRPIGILSDLQGPKLRVGVFENPDGVVLGQDADFRLDMDDTPGDASRVCLPHPEIFDALKPGATLLVNDGHLRLQVTACGSDWADTKVVIPGTMSNRKGVNVPDVQLPIPALTDKDLRDLDFALDHGTDWVALSFVQKPDDIAEAQERIAGRAKLMAKLEKPSAVEHLDKIIELADGVMVARGDLGVELPMEQVPVVQKQILAAARRAGKPAVVATQMLESMIKSPVPTRAEASDVATAVYDGADAVMLSAESAVGLFPARAVGTMTKIINAVEADPRYLDLIDAGRHAPETTAADAISVAARHIAETIGAKALVTYTVSGSTTLRAARERPIAPIVCVTPQEQVARQMALVWGVKGVFRPEINATSDIGAIAEDVSRELELAGPGDDVMLTAGLPFGVVGSTNSVRIVHIG